MTKYKVYSCSEDDYVHRFEADNDAHMELQWEGFLSSASLGTYHLYESTTIFGSRGIWWELVKQGIKDAQ